MLAPEEVSGEAESEEHDGDGEVNEFCGVGDSCGDGVADDGRSGEDEEKWSPGVTGDTVRDGDVLCGATKGTEPIRRCCSKRSFLEAGSIADSTWPLHDLSVEIPRKRLSSLLWALCNLALAAIAFLALYTVRFSGLGIEAIKLILMVLLVTVVLAIRDLWRSSTRWQGFIAFLLCLPVLVFFGLLTVWEGPLYVATRGSSSPDFRVDGAAGFWGVQVYSPEHSDAEWRGDDIGLIWGFDWQSRDKFPPMRLQFRYGTLPTGYSQKAPLLGDASPLDPNVTYTVVVQPAMGMPEYFTLRGGSLTKAGDEYVTPVCWGPLNVSGRSDPAYVRVDCETKKTLAMSERGQARLKAYQEKQLVYY